MRYVQPLREGGSLPAVVDTEDGLYVVKFRGAGQGPKALVAELIVGLLGLRLGLGVPQLALVDLPPPFGRSEPDPEIQDLLRRSHGVNVGLRYLDGAFNFDPTAAGTVITPEFAARVVWLDALVTNPDRTHRNPNLLVWERRPWLIDHGAALYVHHTWKDPDEHARRPFERSREHVLLPFASSVAAASERLAGLVTTSLLEDLVAAIPADWLPPDARAGDADAQRRAYVAYLLARLDARDAFAQEADRARVA
jgi:HipA-like kinase